MADTLRKVMVDGLQVETTDGGAQAIEKLTGERDKARHDLSDAQATQKAALEAKDKAITDAAAAHKTEIEKKDGEIAALKKQVEDAAVTPAKLDAMVKDRASTIDAAKKIMGDKLVAEGRTDADMRRQAVTAKLGDAMVKDWSDDKIAASFATFSSLADTGKTGADPLARALADRQPNPQDSGAAHDAYVKRLGDAWKPAA